MKLIDSSYEILTPISDGGEKELKFIETAARTCYKSEANNEGDFEKTKKFVKGLINRGHEAMLEHSFLSVRFTCDRGVSHELVRSRLFSFAQESTRYVDYSKSKVGKSEIQFIKPYWYDNASFNDTKVFEENLRASEMSYFHLRDCGRRPQECRDILPNATKTEIVVSGNYRNWRHLLSLRAANTTGPAHPAMNKLMCPLLIELHESIPIIFDDIYEKMLDDAQAAKYIESFRV